MLQNKAKLWMSEEEWNFRNQDDFVYIETVSKSRVLGATSNGKLSHFRRL
jgi:hypothetical protein